MCKDRVLLIHGWAHNKSCYSFVKGVDFYTINGMDNTRVAVQDIPRGYLDKYDCVIACSYGCILLDNYLENNTYNGKIVLLSPPMLNRFQKSLYRFVSKILPKLMFKPIIKLGVRLTYWKQMFCKKEMQQAPLECNRLSLALALRCISDYEIHNLPVGCNTYVGKHDHLISMRKIKSYFLKVNVLPCGHCVVQECPNILDKIL